MGGWLSITASCFNEAGGYLILLIIVTIQETINSLLHTSPSELLICVLFACNVDSKNTGYEANFAVPRKPWQHTILDSADSWRISSKCAHFDHVLDHMFTRHAHNHTHFSPPRWGISSAARGKNLHSILHSSTSILQVIAI